MASSQDQPTIESQTRCTISTEAKYLIRRRLFRSQEFEDVVQYLLGCVLAACEKYDERHGRRAAFEHVVLRNAVAKLVHRRIAERRRQFRTQPIIGDEGWEKAVLGERERRAEQSAQEKVDLALDLESVLADASPEQRQATELIKVETITEAARRLNIPRTTLGSRLRKLGKRCEKTGLKDYL